MCLCAFLLSTQNRPCPWTPYLHLTPHLRSFSSGSPPTTRTETSHTTWSSVSSNQKPASSISLTTVRKVQYCRPECTRIKHFLAEVKALCCIVQVWSCPPEPPHKWTMKKNTSGTRQRSRARPSCAALAPKQRNSWRKRRKSPNTAKHSRTTFIMKFLSSGKVAQNETDLMLLLTWRDPLGGDSPVVYVVFSWVLSSGLNVSAAVRPRSLAGLFLTRTRPWVHVFDRCVSTGFCIVGLQKLTAGSRSTPTHKLSSTSTQTCATVHVPESLG